MTSELSSGFGQVKRGMKHHHDHIGDSVQRRDGTRRRTYKHLFHYDHAAIRRLLRASHITQDIIDSGLAGPRGYGTKGSKQFSIDADKRQSERGKESS